MTKRGEVLVSDELQQKATAELQGRATAVEADLHQAISDGSTVAQLLVDSRNAHALYRMQLRETHPVEAKAALATAARLRSEAHTADPNHTAPAWSAESATHPHDELMSFYSQILNR